MIKFLLQIAVSTLSVYVAANIVPGVKVDDIKTALVFSIVLGVLSVLVKPLLVILTLPINILTLGLFTLVINAAMIILAATFVSGFHIESFWWALVFSVVLSTVSWFLHLLV